MTDTQVETPGEAMPGVRWLTEDQQASWRNTLEAQQLLAVQLDQELRSASGIGMSEYELLVRLSEQDEFSMRMALLAREVAMSRSRLTHIVSRMEKRGLVVRKTIEEDGRGVLCTMTQPGYQLLQDAAPHHVRSVRAHLIDILTDEEFSVLGRVYTKVNAHLRGVCHL